MPKDIPVITPVEEMIQRKPSRFAELGRPLRVVSIAHSAFLDGSGRLRYYPLSRRSDLDLTIIIPDAWSETNRPAVNGIEAGPLKIQSHRVLLQDLPRVNWYAHFYPGMARYLRNSSPDVIHLWEEPWSIVALQAAVLRDRLLPDAALVLETEQNILRRLPQPFEWIRRFTLRKTDLLIARQQEAFDVSTACGYSGPSAFVEYAIDPTIFHEHDRASCRQELGIDSFCIGYVGRIIREKGLFTVLQALRECPVPVCFVCMGSGRDQDAFTQEVSRLGLNDRVRLLPFAPAVRVARFMGALDALILMSETTPTWKEQFGRVIIEAQACGTPVIGSDSGAIPQVVGQGGWIVRERNISGLAQLLHVLALNSEERESASSKALQNIRRFAPDIVAESLEEAFVGAHLKRSARTE
jgi:glycosyltransferase involved in cell wall biosynthesis